MDDKLQKLLKARGISDTKDLTPEEKKTFDKWNETLSKKDLKVSDIADFCKIQLEFIEVKLENLDNTDQTNNRLILVMGIYRKIHKYIDGSKAERQSLQKHLEQIVDSA